MSNFYNRAVRLVHQVSAGAKVRPGNDCRMLMAVDKQALERVSRYLVKITKLCANGQLELTMNPPCLQDILQQLDSAILQIVDIYEQRFHILNECEYFRVFLTNVISKLGMLKKLLRQFDYAKQSDHRKALTRFTMTLQHLVFELNGMFPNNLYSENHVRGCMVKEAASWWNKMFATRTIVPWTEFIDSFSVLQKLSGSSAELHALQKTIDLTGDGYVSILEFDTFVRLYQPWKNLIANWTRLAVTHPGYMGYATYDELRMHLETDCREPGSYAFRMSCTKLGQWALGYVSSDRMVVQTILSERLLAAALKEGNDRKLYRYPNGLRDNPLMDDDAAHSSVTDTQYENFVSRFGSLIFAFCEKCGAFAKLTTQLPCFHVICTACTTLVSKHNAVCSSVARNCPLCQSSPQNVRRQLVERQVASRLARSGKKEKDNRRSLAILNDDSPLLMDYDRMPAIDDLLVPPCAKDHALDSRALLNDRNVISEEDPFTFPAKENCASSIAPAQAQTCEPEEAEHSKFDDNFAEMSENEVQSALKDSKRPSSTICEMMKEYLYSQPKNAGKNDDSLLVQQVPHDNDAILLQPCPSGEVPLIDLMRVEPVVAPRSNSLLQDLFSNLLQPAQPAVIQLDASPNRLAALSNNIIYTYTKPKPNTVTEGLLDTQAALMSVSTPLLANASVPPPTLTPSASSALEPAASASNVAAESALSFIDSKIRGMLEKAKSTKLSATDVAKNQTLDQENSDVQRKQTNGNGNGNGNATALNTVKLSSSSRQNLPKTTHRIDKEDEDEDDDEEPDMIQCCTSLMQTQKRDMLVRLIPGLKLCRCSVSCNGFQLTSDTTRQIEETLLSVEKQKQRLARQGTQEASS